MVPDGIVVRDITRIADLPKRFRLFDWKGAGRIADKVKEFRDRYSYKPSIVLRYRPGLAYFIETKVPAGGD